jgi:hypothetical protein
MIDPRGARMHRHKKPAFICPECDALLFEPWKPPADADRTQPRQNDF